MKNIIFLILLINFINCFSIFSKTIITKNNNKISISGNGPPILFSSGLYDAMPNFLYSNFLNNLKKNFTIISVNNILPINSKHQIDDIADSLNVDKISYLSHSSFFPNILNSDKINKAIFLDPIIIPGIGNNNIGTCIIDNNFPVLVIKAEKLYQGNSRLPNIQNPFFQGEIYEEYYNHVGHPDILDDIWSDLAKQFGLWEMTENSIMNYSTWKYNNKNDIYNIRKKYRKNLSSKCSEFLLK